MENLEKNYQIREEPFGFTYYDHDKLTHTFLKPNDLAPFLETKNIESPEIMMNGRYEPRNDIIYSPIRIYYELTLACDLHCKFCFNNSGKPRPQELTTDEVLTSIHKLRDNNVLDLRFTGGEFTRRKDWFQILSKAKNLGFAVSCNTNAIFPVPETAEKLASLNLDQVTVSLDGTEEHHDINRGKGSFKKTMKNVEKLHELGTTLRFNVLLSKLTLNDLEPTAELASKYTNEINFFPIRFIGRGENLESQYAVTWQEFYDFYQKSLEVEKKYPNLRLLTFARANRRASIDKDKEKDFGLRIGTASGITNFNIASDGSLWSGGYLPYIDSSLSMGNIKTDNIFEVWQKNPKLELLRNQASKLKNFCYQCPESNRRCPGAVFEMEIHRQKHPETRNFYCLHGNGEPLLDKINHI
jgi:MoaA/NifB/PqqE/SkfB family radical SAM enzyme